MSLTNHYWFVKQSPINIFLKAIWNPLLTTKAINKRRRKGYDGAQYLFVEKSSDVATLALGSRPRQRGCKSAGQEEARESHHILPGVWESVREWTLTLPMQLPLWEMETRWTPETSEGDFKGQNSMACGVLCIIGKRLEHKFLKWARIIHLDIWNTSYGQKKGRKSNYQFDSRPGKVGNRPDLLDCRWRATYRWKLLMRATTLL